MTLKYIASLFVFTIFYLSAYPQPWKEHGRIQVSKENPHYLAHSDGKPFFWLADTGWEMLHRLNRAETEQYLENRKLKGFNIT